LIDIIDSLKVHRHENKLVGEIILQVS